MVRSEELIALTRGRQSLDRSVWSGGVGGGDQKNLRNDPMQSGAPGFRPASKAPPVSPKKTGLSREKPRET